MGNSFIRLATDGSGKKIDTEVETTDNEHRQVVVLGDPTTKTGVAPVDGTRGSAVYDAGASTVGDGRKVVTTAGVRVQFDSQACKYVIITGEEDNTDIVTVGGSTVVGATATRRGTPLTAFQYMRFDVSNMNLLYLDSEVNGEGVTYTWFS